MTAILSERWIDRDLTDASLRGATFENVRMARVRFSGADLRDARFQGCQLEEVDFGRSSLVSATFGADTTATRTSFDDSDMSDLAPGRVRFEDCTFVNATLDRVSFMESTFVRCRFSGDIGAVTFSARHRRLRGWEETLLDVDMRDAILSGVDFKHLNLDSVELPRGDPELLYLEPFRCSIERALQTSFRDAVGASGNVAELLRFYLRYGGQRQARGVIPTGILAQLVEGAELDRVQAALRLAADECKVMAAT